MERYRKIYSNVHMLPWGAASDNITEGCLVLEGGAFRGLYTSGVLDALMEAGVNLQCVVGVSAGALNGMNYISGQIGRSARINLLYRHDSRYVGVRAVSKNRGIIGFDFVLDGVNATIPFDYDRFFRPERRFVAAVTNCLTGQPLYFDKDKEGRDCLFQAVRASASMPYVSRMVDVDGTPCLDGGCSVPIPYQWALRQSFRKIVVVKTRPDSFRKAVKELSPFSRRFYRLYPQLLQSLKINRQEYNRECDEVERLKKEGKLFVIRPSRPIFVERLEKDMEKLGRLYYLGYYDGKCALPGLTAYLQDETNPR